MDNARGRILVVDDETALVAALCRLLEVHGYETTGATSGLQALHILRAAKLAGHSTFDVLVTDLNMPTMSGMALMRAAQDIDASLVSIVMTGHGTIDNAVAMKDGAFDYLLKPFNMNMAVPVLSRAVVVRRLRLENAALRQQAAAHTAALEETEDYNSSVSHDIRGRLSAMIGCAKMLRDGSLGPLNAQQQEFLNLLLNGGEQLFKLTDDLMNCARLGRERLDSPPNSS